MNIALHKADAPLSSAPGVIADDATQKELTRDGCSSVRDTYELFKQHAACLMTKR
jgi:hypothetical protein